MQRLLTILTVAFALQAQQAALTGTVKGTVTANGAPVASVKVQLSSGADSSYTDNTITNAQGAFSLSGVPVGVVEVRVFDAQGKLAITGKSELKGPGQVLVVPVQVP